MEFDYTFTGTLSKDCKSLDIDFASTIQRQLRPLFGEQMQINITKFHRDRTLAQNNYVWGIVIPTIRAWQKETTGECNTKEAIYAFLRTGIVGDEVIIETVDGVDTLVITGKRFSQCNTVEFAERVDKVIAYYAERDLVIPVPIPKTNNYLTDFTKLNLQDQ
jgi:hypothetical protein